MANENKSQRTDLIPTGLLMEGLHVRLRRLFPFGNRTLREGDLPSIIQEESYNSLVWRRVHVLGPVHSFVVECKIARRILPLLVFLIATSLLFEFPFFAFNGGSKRFQLATFIGLPLLFSAVAALVRWRRRFMDYWPAFSSYVMASVALLLMWLLDDFPRRWLGFDPQGPPGRAIVKVSDAVILLLTVIILTKLLRMDFDSVYLRKGRLWLGLANGVAGFAAMAVFALIEARSWGISNQRILGWAPCILTFVLANGFFEELMTRGLFLRKFEPLLGARLANVLTALVFAVGHAGVTYTADVLVFVAVTFVFALIWGYLMQKTGALWGSALFHAGADTLIIIGIFAGIKT